ncbi:MAG: hypothetical protein JWN17_3084 [Frankiales bacterium]|nr:hypothetical protein [Frankiales bacterium]
MDQVKAEQDVPVGQPYGQGGAGAPLVRPDAGAPAVVGARTGGSTAAGSAAAGAPPGGAEDQHEALKRARSLVRRRERLAVQRPHRLTPRFSDEELEDVRVAAVVAGLTPTGYVAKVAADVAAERLRPAPPGLVEALGELLVARRQVQRFGVLVNQAVAKWHATGELPAELLTAVALVGRVLPGLEQAAASLRRAHERTPARPTVAERLAAQQQVHSTGAGR